jgi:GNAT superfamily N-acetyltransferase
MSAESLGNRAEAQTRGTIPVEIRLATAADIPELVETQMRAFHDDSRRFGLAAGGGEPGGPPGYDSPAWQARMMKVGRYCAIRFEGTIVGGMIVFARGGSRRNLGRIWVDPPFQNMGIGRTAMDYLHRVAAPGCTWTLETPAWAVRNHHVYESMGYRKVGEQATPDGWIEYLYERVSEARPG